MTKLVNDLIKLGYLKTVSIIEALSQINRADFIPADLEKEAEANIPLPIGYGQTISQPLTVAFLLELLDPRPGHVEIQGRLDRAQRVFPRRPYGRLVLSVAATSHGRVSGQSASWQ